MRKITLILILLIALSGCAAESAAPYTPVSEPSPTADIPLPAAPPEPEPTPTEIPAAAIITPDPTPAPTPEPTPDPIVIQMGGDILLHSRLIRTAKTGDNTYDFNPFFAEISKYISGDLNICNIEAPIDVFGGNKDLSTYPRFNSPFEILEAVSNAGFNFFVNANNHSLDKSWSGVVATRENFRKAGVPFTGTYESQEEYDTFTIIDVKGIQVGIIAYTDSLNGLDSLIPKDKTAFAVRRFPSANPSGIGHMLDDIEACREQGAELVIVSLHWGAEYTDSPNKAQIEIAGLLALGGADIIMGNHSHSVQPVEWLEGKDGRMTLCVYSLGNLFADQNDMERPIRKTQYSMLVSAYAKRGADGEVTLTGADYIPTFMHRYADSSKSTGANYILLPSGDFLENEDYFNTNSDWRRNTEAYGHVTKIVGDIDMAAVS